MMQKTDFDLELLLQKQKELLHSAIINKKAIASMIGKKQPNENEINLLLSAHGKINPYYQAHAFLVRSILVSLRKKNTKLSDIPILFSDTIIQEMLLDSSDMQVNISELEVIDLMEQLHFDFLNSEYMVSKGVLAKKVSKMNNREKGAIYTPIEVARKIVIDTVDLWVKRNGKTRIPSVLDFGSGTGRFYFAALDYLEKKFRMSKKKIIENNLYAIDTDPIAVTLLLWKSCLLAGAHTKNFVEEISKKIVCKNMLHVMDGRLAGLDSDEIKYADEFPQIFDHGGFDITVSNPPYFVLKGTGDGKNSGDAYDKYKQRIEEEVKYFRSNNFYNLSIEGMLNYYRLSIECIIKITNKTGSVGIICPATLFGDSSATKIRRELIDKNEISNIEYFPEKFNIFDNITQSTVIFTFNKGRPTSTISLKNNRDGVQISVGAEIIKKIFTGYEIPLITSIEWSILEKISKFKKIKDIREIRNRRGELDLTFYRNAITSEDTRYPLIRGNSIRNGKIVKGKEFVKINEFLEQKSDDYKNNDFDKIRIAGQQIVNIDAKKRLKFTLTQKNHILGNSCNYITVKEPLEIQWILLQLNSEILNWRFKITSTNNHVNNYEIDELPIIESTSSSFNNLNEIEQEVLVCKEFGLTLNETKETLKEHKEMEISRAYRRISS